MQTETALHRFRMLRRRLARELCTHVFDERVDAELLARARALPAPMLAALWREAYRRRCARQA